MSRVAFAISHSESGGAQAIWADLASALKGRGHEVSVVALYPGRTQTLPLNDGLRWAHCLSEPPRSKRDAVLAIRRAFRFLKETAADTVFTALPAANVIFPLAGLFCRRSPKIFISHHSPVFTYRRSLDYLDGWIGSTRAVAGAVCVSRAVQASLSHKSKSYRSKSLVIPNALPPAVEALSSMLRTRRHRGHQPSRTVIACGRLAREKNYPVLIRAMAHVRDATLEIVGAGPSEDELKSLTTVCGVADRVRFLGQKTREATLDLIAKRGVFAQPSLFEGHSLALVEAARIGVPLIVSNVPSQVEAVTRRDGTLCALVHDSNDHLALAASISLLFDDSEVQHRYQMLSESLGDEMRFSTMVDRYEALL